MASPFAKYQSEQVQQIAPGFIEAYGNAGRSIGQGIAAVGAGVGKAIDDADKRAQEEAKTRGGLKAYLKEDPRIKTIEEGLSAGWLAKGADGTVSVVPGKEQLVDPNKAKPYLDFYNQTGGDGSKLTGVKFTEFISEYDASEKLNKERQATQLAADKAKTENALTTAKIAELNSKVAERQANAGMYASLFNTLAGTEQQPLGYNYNAPPVSDGTAVPELNRPVAPAATAPAAVPATQPTVPGAYTEGTSPAAVPQAPVAGKPNAPEAPAQPVYKPEDFDKNGYLKKPAKAAPAAPAPTAAQKAETQAQVQTPAKAAPAPTAPITYDVPAKTVEVNARLAELDKKRLQVVDTFKTKRNATEGQIAVTKRNLLREAPRNQTGANFFKMTLDYNQNLLKSVDDSEARELKRIDDDAQAIKTEFTNYQAAAAAQQRNRQEQREIKKEATELAKTENEFLAKLSEEYPMIGVYTYKGYNLKDPETGKQLNPAIVANVPPMGKEQFTEATEQNKGYGSAKNFLLNMHDILRDREASDDNSYLERFRLTAKNMENYFKAEQSSVFGVATFRKAIVSGGNFSDADREFVKQAITYLNTAAPDMDNKDLRSSLNALTFMIDGMYRVNLEELGMSYNKEASIEKASKLRSMGDNVGAAGIEKQVKTTDRFNSTFNLSTGDALSISKEDIAKARALIQSKFKGLKFAPPTTESK